MVTTQRVAREDVLGIYPTQQVLQPFIEVASCIVSERLNGVYSEERLRHLELYLSAHLAWLGSTTGGSGGGQITSVKADEISISYAGPKLGEGLDGSPYGQMLKLLDDKGILKQAMTSTVAHFEVH